MKHQLILVPVAALTLSYAPYALGATVSSDVSHIFSFAPTGGIIALPSYLFGVSATASPGGTPDAKNGSVVVGTGGGTLTQQASSTGLFSSAVANSSATLPSAAPVTFPFLLAIAFQSTTT